MRYQETNIAFFLTFLLLLILMIFAISHTLKRTRIEKQSQRQNVYTFFSTVFWGILHSTIIILFFLAMRKKKYLILNVLRFVLIFMSHFFKPIITIIEIKRNFPHLFLDNNISKFKPRDFYFNQTNLSPRPEPLMPLIPFQQNAR